VNPQLQDVFDRSLEEAPAWVAERRREGLTSFSGQSMPTQKLEHWRYVDLDFDLDSVTIAGQPGTPLPAGPYVEALSPSAQVKLYQFLETGEFRRAGSNSGVRVNARVIASSRHDLRESVAKKEFREDLFYQLSLITIDVPSLRDRKEDIPQLVNRLMEDSENFPRGKSFSPKALNAILKYDWPGNVRELRNVVERAVILAPKQVVQASDIHVTVEKKSKDRRPRQLMSLKEMEKEHLLYVLNAADGNISRASRILGVSRPKLYRKIEQYKAGEL